MASEVTPSLAKLARYVRETYRSLALVLLLIVENPVQFQ